MSSASPRALFLSPAGMDSRPCTRESPCLTFAHAFSQAPSGSTVFVEPGVYPKPCATISGSKSKAVTFVGIRAPAVPCQLTFRDARNVSVRGINPYQVTVDRSSGISFSNLAVTCKDAPPYELYPPANLCDARLALYDSDHVTFRNVSVGPTYDSSACGGNDTNKISISDSLFYRVRFHDARYQSNCANGGSDSQHTENVYLSRADNVVFDSCRFTNGANSGAVAGGRPDGTGPNTAMLFITGWAGADVTRLVVRNCTFSGAGAASMDGDNFASLSHSMLENNTWTRYAYFQYQSYSSFTIVNNIGDQGSCPVGRALNSSGAVFSHNLWYADSAPQKCGDTDLTLRGRGSEERLFVAPDDGDLSLRKGSLPVGRADRSLFPRLDILGVCRPQGKFPDIGAYEAVATVATTSKKSGSGSAACR